MSLLISSGKRDFSIDPICMNVAGTLGFSDEAHKAIDLSKFGALITSPISLSSRVPARLPRVIEFEGGFLLHTGHPNPGLRRTLRDHLGRWISLKPVLIVHILAQTSGQLSHALDQLEELEAVSAVEVGLGDSDPATAEEIISTASRSELPIIANAPLNVDKSVFLAAVDGGANAISLGPPRGSIHLPGGTLVQGRMFGPTVLPFALHSLTHLVEMVELPVFASGGIYRSSDAEAMLRAGASALQLDSVLWTDPEEILSYFYACGE